MPEHAELAHVQPKPGAEQKLMEARPRFIADVKRMYPGAVISTMLVDRGDGTWNDVWVYRSRAEAEQILEEGDGIPGFVEWRQHADLIKADHLTVIDRQYD
jgi:hypothetical protein